MATRKRAPSKGSPKIRFVQIASSSGVRGRSLYGLTKTGEVYTYLGKGRWGALPVREVLPMEPMFGSYTDAPPSNREQPS